MTNEQDSQTRLSLVILLGVVPALPLLALGVSREYWGRIFLLWGAAHALLNSLSLVPLFRGPRGESGAGVSTLRILSHEGIAWGLSALVLAAINFTPLCLGQDNGDGRNNLTMCVLLTAAWFGAMSILVIPLATLAGVFARRTLRSRRR